MVEVIPFWGFFATNAEAIGLAELVELRGSGVGGGGGGDDGALGEIRAAAEADAAVALGERSGAAVVGLLASAWLGGYSGLASRKRRLLEKECVILAGDVLARCLRMFSLVMRENFFMQ
jgi:hypothetical protein